MEITEIEKIREVFQYFQVPLEDPLLRSLYHGFNGHLYVGYSDSKEPSCMLADIGHTFYFFGDALSKDARTLVSMVKDYAEIHADKSWENLVRDVYKDKVEEHTRFDMDASTLDIKHIKALAKMFEGEHIYREVDEKLYHMLKSEPWTSSMVENFQNEEDFLENGFGVVLLNKEGKILSGTSSFVRYDDGFEIEIATHHDERRNGYALSLAAYFISKVLEKGFTVHWDAANLGSKLLAEKLGFTLKKSYTILDIEL